LAGALSLGFACTKDKPQAGEGEPAPTAVEPGEQQADTSPTPSPTPSPSSTTTVDSPAVADVGEVVATAQLPTGTKRSDVAAVLDSFQPGASMLIAMQLPKALEQAVGFKLNDVKLDAPISVVVVNPTLHELPIAALVEAKNIDALTSKAKAAGYEVRSRGNRALIGPAPVVAAAETFAFEQLGAVPDHSELILYPSLLLSTYADTITEGLDAMGAEMAALGGGGGSDMLRTYFNGLLAVGHQTDRVVLSLGSTPGAPELIARAYPKPGSALASFTAAQVPADPSLLVKLPQTDATMIMVANIHAGAAREPLVDFTLEFMSSMYKGVSRQQWLDVVNPWLDNIDGRFVAAVRFDPTQTQGMPMQSLISTSDSTAMRSAWRAMLTTMAAAPPAEIMGMKFGIRYQTDVLTHEGVAVDLYETVSDYSGLPADQRALVEATASDQPMHLAAFDGFGAMASATDDAAAIQALIDAARGKGGTFVAGDDLTAALALSQKRGDSAIIYFDVSGFAPAQTPFRSLVMTMGKDGAALSMRMAVRK
jgi:hypothetical protein